MSLTTPTNTGRKSQIDEAQLAISAKQEELSRKMSRDSGVESEAMSPTEEGAGQQSRRRSSVLDTLKSAIGLGAK